MSLGLLYWVIILIWMFFGVWSNWPNWRAGGPNLILFVLLVILGWRVFGAPIQP